jgi:hypothetical protein
MVIENDEEWLNLVTGYATTKDCKGVLNYTACTLKSAIGEYDIHLDGDSLTVTNQESPTIIALANNTTPNNTWVEALDGHPSTLSGIASFAINTWNSGVWIQKEPNGNIVPELFGGLSVMTLQVTADPFCPSFRDPRPKVIAGLNRLMFYTGGLAALQYSQADLKARMDEGLSINKTVIGQLEGVHNVYHTDYFFWMAAAIIEVVCIALIAPTYWGWWKVRTPNHNILFGTMYLNVASVRSYNQTLTISDSWADTFLCRHWKWQTSVFNQLEYSEANQ